MAKALVVDDSRAIRMILCGILQELSYEVHSAGDGSEALRYLEDTKPDIELMLVDWNMPGLNGLEFVRRVRELPRYASSALMMVTTETEIEHMVMALEAGANEYVMKPFTTEIISGKLRLMGLGG
jgi:two-component system, chemotaxis family, chemotaxis protein CheY